MSYVDAWYDKKSDRIRVSERINGERVTVDHTPIYEFYAPDPKGKFRDIYGKPMTRVAAANNTQWQQLLRQYSSQNLCESDIKPLNKILEKHYLGASYPKLHKAFFDIETDFDPERGFSSTEDAFAPITSIGVYLEWCQAMICLAVPPPTLTWEQAQDITKDMPEVVLYHTESAMLEAFLTVIDDADILSGWNSEGYDIPYTVNRITQILGRSETRRLNLWDQFPKKRTYERYGNDEVTYDLIGRVHMDYLQLYKKYNYEERHSYSLDFIGEMEVGENKVVYQGSLDQLYRKDFKKFLEYNIQDVMLLDKLDQKLQFIELANIIAHENTVLLPTVMGTVATTDQAIINEAHRRDMVIPDRNRHRGTESADEDRAAGAFVAVPKIGMHDWVGSMDINSLYPSVFRSLNMSPETVIAQVRTTYTDQEISEKIRLEKCSFAAAWNNKFATNEYELIMAKDTQSQLILDMESGESLTLTGAELYTLIFNSNFPWQISANGTVFSREIEGVIPGLLTRWFANRKVQQAHKRHWQVLETGVPIPERLGGSATELLPTFKELSDIFESGSVEDLSAYLQKNNMTIKDGAVHHLDVAYVKEQVKYWDKRQLVTKLALNGTYGALLNAGCRFFDQRIGQSTTLTGRCIVRHMISQTNLVIAGEYDWQGIAVIYSDTDSEIGSTVHKTNFGEKSIEELFSSCSKFWNNGDKEYAYHPDLLVMSYAPETDEPYMGNINYIYRHKVSKDLYEIEDELENTITVTEDHSVMIERGGVLIEAKPTGINETDTLISVNCQRLSEGSQITLYRGKVKSVKKIRKADDEYVYDIGMANTNHPWFFGNDILVHNSAYFSAVPALPNGETLSLSSAIELYDTITQMVTDTFAEFMKKSFNTTIESGAIIRAGREAVARRGLFVTKKRYALLVDDLEGKAYPDGYLKAMGLDLKRSDTPEFIQDFLKDILLKALDGGDEDSVIQDVRDFKQQFRQMQPWAVGTPKRVNNLTSYTEKYNRLRTRNSSKNNKVDVNKLIPGHVTASINWNNLRRAFSDNYSMPISDGAKTIVCRLKPNPLNINSIAYPIDEQHLPDWFKELPFDVESMEAAIIDKKVENVIGATGWDLSKINHTRATKKFSFR
jgi:DNA polymerase elongation subunit (family B)